MAFNGFGASLAIGGMEVIPCDWMTEQVFDYPQDPFIEYGHEDIWWLTKYEGRRWKTVPKSEAIAVDGKLMMHPAMIDKFMAAFNAVDQRRERFVEPVYANAAATTTVDLDFGSLIGLRKSMGMTLGLPKKNWPIDEDFWRLYR